MNRSISKTLSSNDVGTTGGHQAGILVPKQKEILSFFPHLNSEVKNPRTVLVVREIGDNSRWEFNYIYYNNKFFGGTRNEYRLTGMTKFLRAIAAKEGDDLVFSVDANLSFFVELRRKSEASAAGSDDQGVLVLGKGWKIIDT